MGSKPTYQGALYPSARPDQASSTPDCPLTSNTLPWAASAQLPSGIFTEHGHDCTPPAWQRMVLSETHHLLSEPAGALHSPCDKLQANLHPIRVPACLR